jgi:hypothetical protein
MRHGDESESKKDGEWAHANGWKMKLAFKNYLPEESQSEKTKLLVKHNHPSDDDVFSAANR